MVEIGGNNETSCSSIFTVFFKKSVFYGCKFFNMLIVREKLGKKERERERERERSGEREGEGSGEKLVERDWERHR